MDRIFFYFDFCPHKMWISERTPIVSILETIQEVPSLELKVKVILGGGSP